MNNNFNEVSCGYNLIVNGKKYYAPNETINGYVYKDYEAFEGRTSDVAYIPEYAFDELEVAFSVNGIDFYDVEGTYTYNDLYELCQDSFDDFQDEEYGMSFDTVESMLYFLFEELDWAYPSTVIDDMSR